MIRNLGRRPLIMGIINVTPDSFSGDGMMKHADYVAAAVHNAMQMVVDGADLIDIGGESSRPGAQPISAEEEMCRVVPAIAAIHKEVRVPIAIDTVKAEVAAVALDAGAAIINDISALSDPAMMKLATAHNAYVVLMHNRATAEATIEDKRLGGAYAAPAYGDIVDDVAAALGERIQAAHAAGIATEKIIADPGLGFGKTVEQNLALIERLGELKTRLGVPVLIGPSRKSFIGKILDTPVGERLEGTAACVAIGVMHGADIVRVHDVKEMARVVKMVGAIKK